MLTVLKQPNPDSALSRPARGAQKVEAGSPDKLPSKRFKFAVWHDLKECKVTGDTLKAPRVRRAPALSEQRLDPDVGELSYPELHYLEGKDHDAHRNPVENWENAKVANLSYQDLDDDYQRANFLRILARLNNAVIVTLVDNDIESLSSVKLPSCEVLNLSQNRIASFKDLPYLARIKHLVLDDNVIRTLSGIERLKKSGIETLSLKGNEVVLIEDYRKWVFHHLPQLMWLDGLPRLDPDDTQPPSAEKSGTCLLM